MPLPRPLAAPRAPLGRRTLAEEILVVLSLSFLEPAAQAIVDYFKRPLAGQIAFAANQSPLFADQLIPFVFGLAPVLLVLHLLRRTGEGAQTIGLTSDRAWPDVGRGVVLFAFVGLAGVGLYVLAVALGVNRFVVPAPPPDHWWTYPAIFMNAAAAALLEEIVLVGYLITRLQQLGWSSNGAVAGSAVLRGTYHLYQGWGGFAGNLAMGLLFGWIFTRTRRAWPFVVAHFLLDVGAAVGWLLFRRHLPGFSWPRF
jgi:membrane protease YdiL (CAAX protease family)